MAEVWYAENKIHKPAAVKFLLQKFCSDSDVVNRFRTEAEVMVKLNHSNIRQVYDYDEVEDRPCIVMEYLEGADLATRMKHGERFTDEQLQKWWNQLVSALNYTHAQGVVHRDIKPSNIFVTTEGDVKLLDFGIAKVRDSIVSTHTGAMMGTLMYMSPEQVRDSKHIDHKTDLYSLAVTFVHLLTGCAPYDRDTTDDYEIRKNIVEPPLVLDGVPAQWRAFLRPYLAKKPEERPALTEFCAAAAMPQATVVIPASEKTVVSGATVAATRVVADDDTVAETPSTQLQPQPQPRSRKLWPWVVAALAAVVVAIVLLVRGCDGGAKSSGGNGEQTPVEENKDEAKSFQNETFTVNGVSFTMVAVEGGTFTMGCTGEQGNDCLKGEKPAHEVTVSGFYMGETEVTQALWRAVMGSEPTAYGGWTSEKGRGDNYPAYYVSYDDIVNEFIPKLNRLTGRKFRLPTEAEWEYAARGGNKSRGYKYSGSDTIGDVAWNYDNSGCMNHAVKTKRANELGLYDMSGNVKEWCSDLYGDYSSCAQTDPTGPSSGSLRVLRGGSWSINAGGCRVFSRGGNYPGFCNDYYGFRLALVQQ